MATDTEQRVEENDDPQEVVGLDGCNTTVNGSSVEPGELLNDEGDIGFSPHTEISEQFVATPVAVGVDANDGLPRPLDDIHVLPVEPPFNHQARVCMEDDREFVEMFVDETPGVFDEVASNSNILFVRREEFDDIGVRRDRRRFRPDQVNGERFGVRTVEERDEGDGFLRITFVRPVRPACAHFVRTVLCHDPSVPFGEIGHEMMYRNCTARRSVGGAMMSLNAEGVYACELRSPREPISEERHIKKPDHRRLTQYVESVPLFNLQPK